MDGWMDGWMEGRLRGSESRPLEMDEDKFDTAKIGMDGYDDE